MFIVKRFFYLLLILSLFSCEGEKNAFTDARSAKKVSIKLSQISSDCSIWDYFSKIELIQLDTTKESFLKPEGVYRLAFSGDSIYILHKGEDIFVFRSDGISKGALGKKGRGPGEYIFPSDILINDYRHTLDVLESSGEIVSYSLPSFDVNRVLHLPEEGFPYDNFKLIDNDKYLLFSRGNRFRIALYDVKKSRMKLSDYSVPSWLLYSFFTYRNCYSPIISTDDGLKYFEGWNGNVFDIDTTFMKVNPSIRWDMKKNQFNVKQLKPDEDALYYYNVFLKHKDKFATPFTNIIYNKKHCFVNFIYKGLYHTLVYNTLTDDYQVLRETSEKIPMPIGYYNDGATYEIACPSRIDSLISRNMLEDRSRLIYDSIKEDSNLLLIKYTFK